MNFNFALLLVGLAFFAVGVALLNKQLKSQKENTASVTAIVSNYYTEIRHSSHGKSFVHFPVMLYTVSDRQYELRHDVGSGKKKYAIGEQVKLLYDPQQPEHFIIAGDRSTMIAAVIAIGLGIGVILLAFFG